CDLPREIGPCRGLFKHYYHNNIENKCSKFYYGGCRGNGNRFLTKEQCEATCFCIFPGAICDLPPNKGPCKGYLRSYYYNGTKKECSVFIYGGCKGNDNRFPTKRACEFACK
ncbi:unnamed protein product, partial [Staurois parvus]